MVIENKWIEGLATTPLYFAAVLLLNGYLKLDALGFVIAYLILLLIFSNLYRNLVVNRIRNGSNTWLTLGQWCLGQILIIISAWYIGSIAITLST